MTKQVINKFKELRLYFVGFSVITVLYTIFSIIMLLSPDILALFPIRADFIGYLLMGLIIFLFGFSFMLNGMVNCDNH